jgi:HK97 gp10 family phage protein
MARQRAGNPIFTYHPEIERELLFTPEARDLVEMVGDLIAEQAAGDAPKDTGAGAGSIQAVTRLGPNGWEARVSWTKARYYMYFHERGTVHLPARPFLRPAREAARGLI